ncbi:MAG TPA: NAD(P)H-binding protein [Actinophytocola sp.]|jgi:uncharacterized protein YbjT (DUF2867 family)|nr:NAD(P)H-binding protein [Actinophytocola sp.]
MTTIVVTGATGSVGGQVLAQLAGTGVTVRAVGRDALTLGDAAARHQAQPVVADLTDPASLRAALDGADAAFLVFPSVAGDDAAPGTIAALTAAVPRIVYLSAHGVPDSPDLADGAILASHALLEQLIRKSATEWTFLRAGGFATNTLGWAGQIRAGDELRWFGPRITRSLVHEADLAAVGVRALLDEGHDHAAYHLTGPAQLTQTAQLDTIAAVLGRPLRFVDLGPDGAATTLFGAMPPEMARQLVRGQLAMADQPEPVTTEVERLTGRPARPYAEWVRDHLADFR